MDQTSGLLGWLHQIRRFGVSFVRHAPTVPGTVAAIAERVAFRRNSNFGLLWDVVSKPDPDSLAYTAHGLPPHVDLVSRETMPGVQFLHCLVFEATGGDTLLVDGFACAAELARTDPASYELLTTTPLLWRYRDGADTDLSYRGPMIRLDPSGAIREVRCSNTLLAPLDVAARPDARHLPGGAGLRRHRAVGPLRDPRAPAARRRDVLRQLPDPARPDRVRPEQRPSPPAGLLHRSRRLPQPDPHAGGRQPTMTVAGRVALAASAAATMCAMSPSPTAARSSQPDAAEAVAHGIIPAPVSYVSLPEERFELTATSASWSSVMIRR